MDTRVEQPRSEQAARLLALADYIEQSPEPFHMNMWNSCLAGHCARMIGNTKDHEASASAAYLGIDDFDKRRLFSPSAAQLGMDESLFDHLYLVSREWAVNTLRYFALTGRIDWFAARLAIMDFRPPNRNRVTLRVAEPGGSVFIEPPTTARPLSELVDEVIVQAVRGASEHFRRELETAG